MKVLVTGGAGFIASHITDAFIEEGHSVFVLDNLSTGFKKNINSEARFIDADIRDRSLSKIFEEEKFDANPPPLEFWTKTTKTNNMQTIKINTEITTYAPITLIFNSLLS